MSTVTLNVNAYVGTDPGATGTALAVTAMSDFSDATYVSRTLGNSTMTFELGTTSKPAGSMVKSIASNVRVQPTSGSCRFGWWINSPAHFANVSGSTNQVATTIADFYGPVDTSLGDLTQAHIDQLRVACRAVSPTTSAVRFVRIDATIVFAEQPVTAIISPTGTITASSTTVTWSHTPGTDGGDQQWYEMKVFTAAQFNGTGFSPDTTPPLIASGPWASSGSAHGLTDLPAGSIRIYVRTAQNVNGAQHWAAWDFEAITVSLTTSEVLDVTPTAVNADGLVAVTVTRNTGTDAWHHVELQRNDTADEFATIGQFTTSAGGIGTGWAAYQFGSPTSTSRTIQTSGVGGRGDHQRLAATTTNATSYGLSPSAPLNTVACAEGDEVELSLDIKGTFAATSRLNLITIFYDSTAATVADLRTQHTPVTSTNWSRISHTATAPAGTASVTAFFEGTASTGTPAAFTADIDEVRLVINGGWVDVRDVVDVLPAASTGTWDDYEAPPTPVRYRARAVKSDATIGAWIEQVGTTTWVPAAVWFKSVTNPLRNVVLNLVAFPEPVQDIQQGIFHPLATSDVDVVYPLIVSEPRQARTGEWLIRTETAAEVAALRTLLAERVLLVHAPTGYQFVPGYFVPGRLSGRALNGARVDVPHRDWSVEFVEVEAP